MVLRKQNVLLMNKILIISSNSFSKKTNNGKTMESIFSGFRKEQLMQLFFSMNENPDFDFCENYYKFTDVDLLKSFVFKNYLSLSVNQNLKIEKVDPGWLFKRLKSVFSSCNILRELIWIKAYTNKNIIDWVERNKPDAIFLYAGNLTYLYDFALYLSEKLNIPLFSYFSDDYAYFPSTYNPFDYLQKIWINRKYYNVIPKSKICFGIGDEMCRYYSEIYIKNFYPIMNSVVIPDCVFYVNIENKKKITLTYIGGLTIGRAESLCDLSSMINGLKIEDVIEVNVYTPTALSKKIRDKFERIGVVLHLPVYGDKLNEVQQEADILLHVESSKRCYYSFAQLSVSTKIPEYLISGKIILAYGPSCLASFKLLKEHNLGFVVSSDESLDKKIKDLQYFFGSLREGVIRSEIAFKYARKKFDIKRNSKDFFEILNSNINIKT